MSTIAAHTLLFRFFLLTFISGCGWIGIENRQIDDTVSDSSTNTDSMPGPVDTDGTDSRSDSDIAGAEDTETGTDTASDTFTGMDSTHHPVDTGSTASLSDSNSEDTETGTDASSPDSDSVAATGTDSVTSSDTIPTDIGTSSVGDTDTATECPALPNGTELLSVAVMDPDGLSYMLFLDSEWIGLEMMTGDETVFDFGTRPWRIGLAVPDAVEYGWYGDLSVDDVRIYNRALTLHEVQTLANPS